MLLFQCFFFPVSYLLLVDTSVSPQEKYHSPLESLLPTLLCHKTHNFIRNHWADMLQVVLTELTITVIQSQSPWAVHLHLLATSLLVFGL